MNMIIDNPICHQSIYWHTATSVAVSDFGLAQVLVHYVIAHMFNISKFY